MSLDDFVKEHKRLIKLLDSGNKKQLKQEAKRQTAELKKKLLK
jgi:hypothetical protein